MKLTVLLAIIAIAAFIFSRFARYKGKSVLVAYDFTIGEELVAQWGLTTGQKVKLRLSSIPGRIDVIAMDAAAREHELGPIEDRIIYDTVQRKEVKAYIYAINGSIVTTEVKLHDAL